MQVQPTSEHMVHDDFECVCMRRSSSCPDVYLVTALCLCCHFSGVDSRACSNEFMDVHNVVTGRAWMLHILARIHTERDKTARPAQEDHQCATDQPGEQTIFVLDSSDNTVSAMRTRHVSRNIRRQLLHHHHRVHLLYDLRLLWVVQVSRLLNGLDARLSLVDSRVVCGETWVRWCWHFQRRSLTLFHDIL